MTEKRRIAWFLTALVFIGAGGIVLRVAGQAASPERQSTESVESKRWEYCAIRRVSPEHSRFGPPTWFGVIDYFSRPQGRQEVLRFEREPFSSRAFATSQEEILAVAIAKLGEEGWEMVGTGPLDGYWSEQARPVLYFKRPAR